MNQIDFTALSITQGGCDDAGRIAVAVIEGGTGQSGRATLTLGVPTEVLPDFIVRLAAIGTEAARRRARSNAADAASPLAAMPVPLTTAEIVASPEDEQVILSLSLGEDLMFPVSLDRVAALDPMVALSRIVSS